MTSSAMKADLRLVGVGVQLGARWVINHIDLRVEAGRTLAIAGPSGAGKTVLCGVLAGVVEPSRGAIHYGGGSMKHERPNVGLILQNHGLLSGLTAAENVAFPLQARRLERDVAMARVDAALSAVGLSEQKDRPVDELSGGQRQRVGVARALAVDPEILVADEPTAELDPDNRQRVLDLLLAHASRGNVVIVASDDPDVIDECDRVVHLLDGEIVRTTTRAPSSGASPAAPSPGDLRGEGAGPPPGSASADGGKGRRTRRRTRLRLAVVVLAALAALDAAALAVTLSHGASPTAGVGRGPGYLGVRVGPQPPGLPPGVRVAAVHSGSPAAKAGIVRGDVIVLFGPKPVRTGAELRRDLDHAHPGSRQLLTWVTRSGRRETTDVTLGSSPTTR